MKTFLLFIFVFINHSCIAGEKILGIFFSPEYSYRTVSSDGPTWIKKYRNKYDQPGFGYTVGISYSKSISARMLYEFGANLAFEGWGTKKFSLDSSMQAGSPINVSRDYRYTILEFPLKLSYRILPDKKYFVSLGLMLSSQIFGKTKSVYEYSDGSISELSVSHSYSPGRMGFTFFAGLPGYFQLSNWLHIKVGPFFKYFGYLKYETTDLYSFGIEVGLSLIKNTGNNK